LVPDAISATPSALDSSSSRGHHLPAGWGWSADSPSLARPPKFSELFGDEVLARGKGVEVRQSSLDQAYISLKATVSARGQDIPEGSRTRQEAQLLDRLIVTQLLTNRVTEADRTNAQVLAEKYFADTKKGLSDESFQRHLKALGMSTDEFARRVREQSLADAVLQRELRAKLNIADAQVRDFYENGNDVLVRTMRADLEKLVNDPSHRPSRSRRSSSGSMTFERRISRLDQPEREGRARFHGDARPGNGSATIGRHEGGEAPPDGAHSRARSGR
jgi:hypothetical protein